MAHAVLVYLYVNPKAALVLGASIMETWGLAFEMHSLKQNQVQIRQKMMVDNDLPCCSSLLQIDEYVADPNTFPGNLYIIQAYKEAIKAGHMIQPAVHPHFIKVKPDTSYYQIRPCDPSQPCDLTRKEWEKWALKDQVEQVFTPKSSDKPKSNI